MPVFYRQNFSLDGSGDHPMLADASRRLKLTSWLLAATPAFVLLAHYAAVLPHEFSHSFAAWIMGIKSDPWNIEWGHGSVGDILLLQGIDEKVDYKPALADGKNLAVAVTVLAGPGMNVVLYLLTRFVVPCWRTSSRGVVAYLTFWFLFMNLANLYDYVPIRIAASNGDVWQWIQATNMSYWWIYGIIGALVLWALVDFYRTVLPQSLEASGIETISGRMLVLVTSTALMFAYFASPGLAQSDDVSLFIGRTSLLLVPVVILINWRRVATRTS
jgi:hypothetical protein